jgi:hypothetical protein
MTVIFLCAIRCDKLNRSLRNFYVHAASTTTIDKIDASFASREIAQSLIAQTSMNGVVETAVRR